MWIGVVADTMGSLHPEISKVFDGLDFILHCGGIGAPEVLMKLSNWAPTNGALGTDDRDEGFQPLGEHLLRSFFDVPILVKHDIGTPMRPSPGAKRLIQEVEPKVLLFGKTLEPFNASIDERLWFNPGCGAARHRRARPSVGILEIDGASVRGEIIPLDQAL